MTGPVDGSPRIADTVVTFTPSDGSDTIVFDDEARRWYRLPGTAAAIWASIDGHRSVAAIAEEVAAGYATDPQAITGDVERMMETLRGHRLLTE
jgi:hypothetical protein